MAEEPRWRSDFPIEWERDHLLTRREFSRFLVLSSLGLFVGNCWVAMKAFFRRTPVMPTVDVASVAEVPVGGVKLFHYPTPDVPAILIRLGEERFVAYEQKCTHLSCPVYYDPKKTRLMCPCHEGSFYAEDGRVAGGPPERPLPRVRVEVREGRLVATGREGEAI